MVINYSVLNKVSNLRRAFYVLFIFFLGQIAIHAQCATPVMGCSFTDLSNFGVDSNNNARTIEYDNFVSSYHATIVRTSDGSLQIWGEKVAGSGSADILSPITINAANYPALNAATPLKAALGSDNGNLVQGILLATDGLYAWSVEGTVLDDQITSGNSFEKLTINGNTNGLPTGVNPGDVKMMFATFKTLAITTCAGEVWVISQTPEVRGNGSTGDALTWYRVTTSDLGNPFLTDVVACRGNYDGLMALKSDGSVYVWGSNVLLGNNTPIIANQNRAAQMTLPVGITPKMIGSSGNNTLRSYYILATDGNLFTLGRNASRQLGDWTGTDRFSWVQPRYNSATGPVMNDIKWFSVQEHDATYGSVNVINSNKNLYAFGQNHFNLLGVPGNSSNPSMPTGLTVNDKILAVETGGHTSMIVKNCEGNFGYAGHRIRGSMGNGSNANVTETVYTFATAPVQICGVETLPVIKVSATGEGPNSKYCVGQPVTLNLTPAGGKLSVLSGPGSVSGNILTFTGEGTVVIEYSVSDSCGGVPTLTTRSFETALCPSDLQITKVVDNQNPSIGTNSVFTITATNNGPFKASGVVVNDVLPSGYTFVSATPSVGTWSAPNWTIGNLASGASATLSITATINSSGSYTNTAVISGNENDPDLLNNTSTVTPVVQSNLSVTKTASNATPSVGERITFTITASNAGPSTATGVSINDVLPSGYTFVSATPSVGTWSAPNWTVGNLANGANATLSVVAAVNGSGSYTNTAVISGNENDPDLLNNTSTVTPVVQSNLSVTKTASSATPSVGERITFTITASNAGPSTATGVSINDVLPSGYTFVSATPSVGTWSAPNWTVGNLANGANATLSVVAAVNGSGSYTNTAIISGNENDPDLLNNTSTVTPVVQSNLSVTKTASSATPSVGERITFTITASNAGPSTATGVSINDVLPSGYTFVSATPSVGTWSAPNWTVGNLANGANATLSVVAEVNGSGSYTNTAVISGNENDPDLLNNTATVTPVVQSNLFVTKTASITTPSVGERITFTITASNAGPSTATGVSINDVLPSGYTFVSATPSVGTWSAPNWTVGNLAHNANATLTVTAIVNATGSYTNTAIISGEQDDPDRNNNTASVTPNVNHLPIAYDDTNANIPSTSDATAINPLRATDSDGTIVSFTVITLPSNGVLALNGNPIAAGQVLTPSEAANLTYDPSGLFTGNDTFTFLATDNSGAVSASATITIPVGNNPPVAHDGLGVTIPSKAGATQLDPLTATDTDGTVESYTIVTLPSHGVLTLNGTAITAGQVLTPVEASNIMYDPNGNFAGNDSFTFTATDNDGAIDQTPAVITITIENTDIDAVLDQQSVVSTDQTITVLNVLDNDTLDHNPVILSEVDLKILVPDSSGFLTLNPDGTIELAANTPAGVYTLTYEICEKANTTNCSSAQVSITVEEPNFEIKAETHCANNLPYVSYEVVEDNFTPNGLLTINWINNNGDVVATQSNMPLKGDILWLGTTVDSNNNRTNWPGWKFVNGQWIPDNDGFQSAFTLQFVLNSNKTVVVNYPSGSSCNARPPFTIQAIDEPNVILADGTNGSMEIVNVLDNDLLNGNPVKAAEVEVKGLDFPTGITINPDGTIDVAPNTAGGSYTITYEICEAAHLSNCSTATVSIFVEVPSVAILKTVTFNDTNGNGFSEAGETLTYNFSITNTGNTDLQNILIADPLPGIILNGGPINLAVGETDNSTFSATYTLSQLDVNQGMVSNQATVSAVTKNGSIVLDKSHPTDFNNDGFTTIELNGCVIKVFNAVSADGDGINEKFVIRGLECFPDNTVQIFNRWGVLVFERDHYNNNDIVFRGISEGRVTHKEADGLPEGTYYYILRYKDGQSNPRQEAGYLYFTR
ncbi:DUF11 domain-containing protein [Flavobacterium sp. 17A]|uniref:DUF11 domain-containing protein n=1 Tax=Flavobacterium potami TaxID=2872310 RepID=A0A9X1KP62_9FLAO|nr:gliding motility-associated C-terminal domain-containing protein [Flavobacterium potami]MBZ4034255.1 DUF11 domain-containing protein [Flavobacterium potami]